MLLALMLLAGAQDGDRVDAMIATYHAKTTVEVPCKAPADGGEITVCARREADRYRVPLVNHGSERDTVPLRTAKLIHDNSRLPCGERAIIADCGPGVGVSASINSDGSTHLVAREPTP